MENLTVTFVDKNRVYMRYASRNGVFCSRWGLRLMRQHQLEDFFRIGKSYQLSEVRGQNFIPLTNHPHDVWEAAHPVKDTFKGRVIAIHDKNGVQRLLVELSRNVLAFAVKSYEAEPERQRLQNGDPVTFIFERYNRKTKRIYGYVE